MENDLLGKAIYCECYIPEYGRHKILGSITSEGILEIVRGHRNRTIIKTLEYLISCPDCGFSQFINLKSLQYAQS